jgi:hypothetical protein
MTASTRVATVMSIDSLRVDLTLPESAVTDVHEGAPIDLSIAGDRGLPTRRPARRRVPFPKRAPEGGRRPLGMVGLAALWGDETGPRPLAQRALSDGALPPEETLFLLAAWNVWLGEDLGSVSEGFARIDHRLARSLDALGLILRSDAAAIDDWLARGSLGRRR